MPDVPAEAEAEEPTVETITEGYFEKEFHIDSTSAGEFLTELGEQLEGGDEITITGDGWELPFRFDEPVALEIEFEGDGDPELEIGIELSGETDDETPGIV